MIAIIDYRAGNLTSVRLALEALGIDGRITDDAEMILAADRVIFPGVGAAGTAMENLRALGLDKAIHAVVAAGTPFLGICLGTQLIFEYSEEDAGTPCLGLVRGQVTRFRPTSPFDKVPQMGWNGVRQTMQHPIFSGIEDGSEFYFVHSYYPKPSESGCIAGATEYAGLTFASAVVSGNLVATQFHPEKSGRIGLRLLKNFANWTP